MPLCGRHRVSLTVKNNNAWADIVSKSAIIYKNLVMLLPISEAVPLLPGVVARVEHVAQDAATAVPRRFSHFHGPVELVLVKAGTGAFISENEPVSFSPGSLVFVPPMAVHDFAFDEGERAWTLVQFDPYALDSESPSIPPAPMATRLDPKQFDRIEMLMDWLGQSLATEPDQRAVALQLETLILAIRQATARTWPTAQDTGSALSRFRPLLDQLNREQSKSLRLADAASLCGMSAPYFSRRFKSLFGTGFSAYQTRMKVLQAARILATSNMSVSQVCYALGFCSPAYFTYCFRSAFGVTPTKHRTQK